MKLPLYQPRQFLPEKIDLSDIHVLKNVYRRLRTQLKKVRTVPQLETWLDHYDEVQVAIAQAKEERYVAWTRNQNDPARQKAYNHFIDVVMPWCQLRESNLDDILLSKRAYKKLPPYYDVYRKPPKVKATTYDKARFSLEAKEEKLRNAYDTIYGNLSIPFEGKTRTADDLYNLFFDAKPARRKAAWFAYNEMYAKKSDELYDLYAQQVQVRHQIALKAGYKNYRDYVFADRDYTPRDCYRFHKTIEKHVVPLIRRLNEERRQTLGAETLRQWDYYVDALNRKPLHPFHNVKEMVDKTEQALEALHPPFAERFRVLRNHQLMDLESRKGKSPDAYSTDLPESRLPFTFANVLGSQYDLSNFHHEIGHGLHSLAYREQRLYHYRWSMPLEFCETISTSMEHLMATQYDKFYPPAEARRAEREVLESAVYQFEKLVIMDAFQHWVYTHPEAGKKAWNKAWLQVNKRFDSGIDWSGVEQAHEQEWLQIPHLFNSPFYSIEYPIARMGSLQVWKKAKDDPQAALEDLFKGMQLGGSKPLPELFKAAGLKFDLSEKSMIPIMAEVSKELDRLNDAPHRKKVPIPSLHFQKSRDIAALSPPREHVRSHP